jgi:hypothetical protein
MQLVAVHDVAATVAELEACRSDAQRVTGA